MKKEKRITVHVPEGLLAKAQRQTGVGIAETVRLGLRFVAAGESYRNLRELRAKVRIEVDLPALREDR